MSDFIIALEERLKADGWRIEGDGDGPHCIFHAWKSLKGVPCCVSNEKLPCAAISIYNFPSQGRNHQTCEVKLAGDVGDQWIEFNVYGINSSDLVFKLPRVIGILKRTWTAAFVEPEG